MQPKNNSFIQIILSDFTHYDKASLEEYIALQETQDFEIIIPRQYFDYLPEDAEWLSHEYILCGYAGELLSKTVTKFAYNVPYPYGTDPVVFRVQVEDFGPFNETLYRLVKCAINDGNDVDSQSEFFSEACAMFDQFGEGALGPTLGLFAAAYSLIYPDIVDEDDRDEEEDEEAE